MLPPPPAPATVAAPQSGFCDATLGCPQAVVSPGGVCPPLTVLPGI